MKPAKLLRIFLSEGERSGKRPIYEVIVEKCREMQLAGATVLRGCEGFGSGPEIHHARLLAADCPIEIVIVDEAPKIEGLILAIEGLLQTGTMIVSNVEAMRVQPH